MEKEDFCSQCAGHYTCFLMGAKPASSPEHIPLSVWAMGIWSSSHRKLEEHFQRLEAADTWAKIPQHLVTRKLWVGNIPHLGLGRELRSPSHPPMP